MEEITHIRNLCRDGQFRRALTLIEPIIERNPLSPFLFILKSILIQSDEGDSDFIYLLEDAEKYLLHALEINDQDIEAMIELAHFYDVMMPNPAKAYKYSSQVLKRIKKIKLEMTEILRDNKNLD